MAVLSRDSMQSQPEPAAPALMLPVFQVQDEGF